MRLLSILITLLFIITTSSFQCDKCIVRNDEFLDDSRQWLPVTNMTQIDFINQSGVTNTFARLSIDSIETATGCADNTFKVEFVSDKIFLDNSNSHYLNFSIHDINILSVAEVRDSLTKFRKSDILNRADLDVVRFSNHNIGNVIYPEVILLKSNQTNPSIDSIYLAKNIGLAGFKYNGDKFTIH